MMKEEDLNFEDEILFRRVDCNIPLKLLGVIIIRVSYQELIEIKRRE
jgi:hypothetical protein